jgi:D-alanyl-D-alanine carboxypeptidase
VERPALKTASGPPAAPAAIPQPEVRPPAIEIARVRPVLVSPGAAQPSTAPLPLRGSPPTGFEDILARAEVSHDSAADPTAEASASPQPRWTTASAGKPALPPGGASALGASPSTLEQQAANLARGDRPSAQLEPGPPLAPPRPIRASKPAPPTAAPAPAAGAFHIQIGAYQSLAEAEKRLAWARELAPGLLANRSPVTTQVKQGDKLFYRARYAGFEAKAAAGACTELKRLKIDCLVMKAQQ